MGEAGAGNDVVLVLVTGLQGTGKSTTAHAVGDALGAPVFTWDWFMAALTPYEPIQAALQSMTKAEYRSVGWSLLLQAARLQLRHGHSVVLDGLARDAEVESVRALGRETGTRTFVVLTTCSEAVQRSRIEGRERAIPGWHELTWEDVQRTRRNWVEPRDIDHRLADRPVADLAASVVELLRAGR